MKPVLKRLLVALFVPPVLGAALVQVVLIVMAFTKDGARALISEQFAMFMALLLYGFIFCLVPGLGYWGLLEAAWKFGGATLKKKAPFGLLGGGLGGVCGVVVAVLFTENDLWGQRVVIFCSVGVVVGLSTSALIYPHHERKSEA